jgi:hypothetical protein
MVARQRLINSQRRRTVSGWRLPQTEQTSRLRQIGDGRLGSVSSRHFGGVRLYLIPAFLRPMAVRRPLTTAHPEFPTIFGFRGSDGLPLEVLHRVGPATGEGLDMIFPETGTSAAGLSG